MRSSFSEGDFGLPFLFDRDDSYSREQLASMLIGSFSSAYYPPEARFNAYKAGRGDPDHAHEVSFCSAGLPDPYPVARARALRQEELTERFEFHAYSPEARVIESIARVRAAELVGLPDARGVALCRNTTEALSLVKPFGHFDAVPKDSFIRSFLGYHGPQHATEKSPFHGLVLCSSLETASVLRMTFVDCLSHHPHDQITTHSEMDAHQAAKRADGNDGSTWFEERLAANHMLPIIIPFSGISNAERKANIWRMVESLSDVMRGEPTELPDGFDQRAEIFTTLWISKLAGWEGPKFLERVSFIVSHVDRVTGEILPVSELAEELKAAFAKTFPGVSRPLIVVDGAQALGNVPRINFRELGCDLYAASPHKTLGSEVLGVLFFDPENPRFGDYRGNFFNTRSIDMPIRVGTFDPRLEICPNTSEYLSHQDLVGFIAACEANQERYGVRGNNFGPLSSRRLERRSETEQILKRMAAELGLGYVSPQIASPSPFILAFNFDAVRRMDIDLKSHQDPYERIDPMGYKIAEQLGALGIFVNYFDEDCYFRLSFRPDHTAEDIRKLEHGLKAVLDSPACGELWRDSK